MEVLQKIRGVLRRQRLFYTKGIKFLTLRSFTQLAIDKLTIFISLLTNDDRKKILWVGCFPYWHNNIGDQAQTLALEKFFKVEFNEYKVIKVTRNEVGSVRWNKIVSKVSSEDLIFLHSTGDFGSKYINQKAYRGNLSWGEVRRKVVKTFPLNKIVQLPVTVFYSDCQEGIRTADLDREYYRNKSLIVLCRETKSDSILEENNISQHMFFPDFVFYLQPQLLNKPRKGALLMLRGKDKESIFNEEDKEKIKGLMEIVMSDVTVQDIMKSTFPLTPLIRDNFINKLLEIYQGYELIVTDRMHGMIISVITKTPCIALDEAIPHKLSGYKAMLRKSVEFVSDINDIPCTIKRIQGKSYQKTDLRHHFKFFEKEVLDALQ